MLHVTLSKGVNPQHVRKFTPHSPEAPMTQSVKRARYMTLGSITTLGDDPTVMLPAVAACRDRATQPGCTMTMLLLHHGKGHDHRGRLSGPST